MNLAPANALSRRPGPRRYPARPRGVVQRAGPSGSASRDASRRAAAAAPITITGAEGGRVDVRNVHERRFAAPPAAVGRLLDGLASADDRLWPRGRWPAMRFDRPLAVGAAGGHGPVRYTVEAYTPGASVRFRFTGPPGFLGTHGYDVGPLGDGGTRLRHTLAMRTAGAARLTWPLVFRPLHDALIEDSLDRAAVALGLAPVGAPWSLAVRGLRRVLTRARRGAATGPRGA